MRTAIVYYSEHHGNTWRLVEAIHDFDTNIRLVDTAETKITILDAYDCVGVASGIYYGKFNADLMAYLRERLPEGRKVFALYTCGNMMKGYTKELQVVAAEKNCSWLGEYGCLGFDTFGPFKLVGGLQKGHPTEEEIVGAVEFYKGLGLETMNDE